jgi:four helix bundle protein
MQEPNQAFRMSMMGQFPYVDRFQDLEVYRASRILARDIYLLSRAFPSDERYGLTNQIRRSSGSVGAQIAEAWAKRRFIRHFVAKLTDADGEQLETQHWLQLARNREYLSIGSAEPLEETCAAIGRMLGTMIRRAPSFCRPGSSEFDPS